MGMGLDEKAMDGKLQISEGKMEGHHENVFEWTKVVRNTPGPLLSTMVLPVPLVHFWSTLIQLGPLHVTILRKSRTKVHQGGPG